MKRLTRLLALLLFTAGVATLTACNTAEGVGEDMQDAGEEIEDAFD